MYFSRAVSDAHIAELWMADPPAMGDVAPAAESPQHLGEDQADHDEDDGDGARRPHLVGLESGLVHLEREASEVSEPFLAHLQERLSLAFELARRWRRVRGPSWTYRAARRVSFPGHENQRRRLARRENRVGVCEVEAQRPRSGRF